MGGKCQEDSVIRVWSISKQNKYQAFLDLELCITQAPHWDFFHTMHFQTGIFQFMLLFIQFMLLFIYFRVST